MDRVPESPEELIGSYGGAVFAAVYRVCLRHDLAEEACAKALHAGWAKRADFSGAAAFKTWITRIAINAAIDVLRRERAQRPGFWVDLDAAGERPEPPPAGAEAAAEVRAALARMDELHRVVLVLREWEGLSYKEIAEAMDCPIGTVMSRLSHARRILKEILSEGER